VLDSVNGGSALTALVKVSLAVCTFVFGLIYRRYLGILGPSRSRPAERQAYDTLRNSLAKIWQPGPMPSGLPGSSLGLTASSVMPEWATVRSSRMPSV
jgi:hypothetical protein